MNNFKEFLVKENNIVLEQDEHLKTHLSHIEDLAIEEGTAGFAKFLQHIEEITKKLQGFETNQEINAKIDGSPMIIFGYDPRPQYKKAFFVALKSGLSPTNPKIIHNEKELQQFYGNEETLRAKLDNLLKYLPQAYDGSGKIYQGDVLFSVPSDKTTVKIGEETFIAFKPNVIVYAVPLDLQSELSNKIQNAEVGVIIHESFTGTPINENKAIKLTSAGRNVQNLINNSKGTKVFLESSNYSQVRINIPDAILKKIRAATAKATMHINGIDPAFNNTYTSSPVLSLLKIFLNKQVDIAPRGIFGAAARGEDFVVSNFIKEFREFLISRYNKEKETKKTPGGKTKVESRLNEVLNFLETNKDNFNNLILGTYYMTSAKYSLLEALSIMETKLGKKFIHNPDGSFTTTKDEGYVLFVGTNHVKIVDRLEFTKINRAIGGKRRTALAAA